MRPDTTEDAKPSLEISIHAPRVGCDGKYISFALILYPISIHAPRVGCDYDLTGYLILIDISIHAPRVGCDRSTVKAPRCKLISIHAPRVGCDVIIRVVGRD